SGHHSTRELRPRRRFAARLALLIFLLFAALQSISFYVESLWYGSLGFESVYWYRLRAQSLVFLTVAALTTVVLCFLVRIAIPSAGFSPRPFPQIGQEAIAIPTSDTLKRLALPAAIVIGLFFGLVFSADWNTFALFANRSATPSAVDPIFGHELSFYF